jgi:hypothetical protein
LKNSNKYASYHQPHVNRTPVDVFPILGGQKETCLSLFAGFYSGCDLRLLHMMNVRFSLLDIAQRILGVTLPNFQ